MHYKYRRFFTGTLLNFLYQIPRIKKILYSLCPENSRLLRECISGNAIERPGELNDHLLSPYPNIAAAKAANGGAFPPDLSMLLLTREGAEDYVFSLLTSYVDTPAGVKVCSHKILQKSFKF